MTNWLIVGTDQRLELANKLLNETGHASRYVAADSFNQEVKQQLADWKPDTLVLPLLKMKETIPADLLRKDALLFTGQTMADWQLELDQRGIRHRSYLKDENFIWQNARLTAEAFVQVFYEQTKRQIAGKHFYVTGFGRVGKAVAQVLKSLQASVTVTARSEIQLAEAAVSGYETLLLTDQTKFDKGYMVNTIPAQWLDHSQSGETRIFDLASAPGCLKHPHSSEYYTIHLKLPGIHFPEDAAAVLAESVLRMSIEERGTRCLKENESD